MAIKYRHKLVTYVSFILAAVLGSLVVLGGGSNLFTESASASFVGGVNPSGSVASQPLAMEGDSSSPAVVAAPTSSPVASQPVQKKSVSYQQSAKVFWAGRSDGVQWMIVGVGGLLVVFALYYACKACLRKSPESESDLRRKLDELRKKMVTGNGQQQDLSAIREQHVSIAAWEKKLYVAYGDKDAQEALGASLEAAYGFLDRHAFANLLAHLSEKNDDDIDGDERKCRYLFRLTRNGAQLCLADAIADKLKSWEVSSNDDDLSEYEGEEHPFPLDEALQLQLLMKKAGYLPVGFEELLKTKKEQEMERDAYLMQQYEDLMIQRMETIGKVLVSGFRIDKMDDSIDSIDMRVNRLGVQDLLVRLMKFFGVDQPYDNKLLNAYRYLQEDDWNALLKLLQERFLHSYLLLLTLYDRDECCLADAIANKLMSWESSLEHPFPLDEAGELLDQMKEVGYEPKGLKHYINKQKKHALQTNM